MADERLNRYFKLSEFLRSSIAVYAGIDNTPNATAMANVKNILAPGMLRVREALGDPVQITSGFRCLAVNRKLGSKDTSDHVKGLAADFVCPSHGSPRAVTKYLAARFDQIGFDQLIFEGKWVHISFPGIDETAAREVLTAHFTGGGVTYTRGVV